MDTIPDRFRQRGNLYSLLNWSTFSLRKLAALQTSSNVLKVAIADQSDTTQIPSHCHGDCEKRIALSVGHGVSIPVGVDAACSSYRVLHLYSELEAPVAIMIN